MNKVIIILFMFGIFTSCSCYSEKEFLDKEVELTNTNQKVATLEKENVALKQTLQEISAEIIVLSVAISEKNDSRQMEALQKISDLLGSQSSTQK